MSYILEALKKLEQKRQQVGTPNLLTLQGNNAPVRKKRSLLPYIISGILLLNGVIVLLLFWSAPWKNSTQPSPHKQQMAARESTTTPQARTFPEKNEEPPSKAKNDPAKTSAPAQGKVVPEATSPRAAPPQPPRPAQTPDESLTKATKPVPPSTKVLGIKELPADVKSKLPELKMTVHSYNEQPQFRFTVINNNTVREGQFVNGELKLEKINQGGVILNYHGHRFTLGINETP